MPNNNGNTVIHSQTTSVVLMIFPSSFGLNTQTAASNTFQLQSLTEDEKKVRDTAVSEFEKAVAALQTQGIQVVVCPSQTDVDTPDAIFPNNWISFHEDCVVTYPMLTPNRRNERQLENVEAVLEKAVGFAKKPNLDLSTLENQGKILEGTGSLVLDREKRVAFATLSARTTTAAIEIFTEKTGFSVITFRSFDQKNKEIYHTNVMMSLGEKFAVICLDAITDLSEKENVIRQLIELDKEIIAISLSQMHAFCGNILQLKNTEGKFKIAMSAAAKAAFSESQLTQLKKHGELIVVDIPTIEAVGGGGIRCMLAEVF